MLSIGANNLLPLINEMKLEELKKLINSLSPEEKEVLLKEELAKEKVDKSNIDLVRELMHSLSFEERVQLLQEELKSAGLTVILGGNNNTTAEISVQIHTAEALEVDKILEAISSRIKTDSPQNSSKTRNS
ncbi:MAG: hypothetical protein QNJ54_28850 [Prochloraceae cyanobacterium]|nr:hypothetical protein [Prochloraceae cyanobacterium]